MDDRLCRKCLYYKLFVIGSVSSVLPNFLRFLSVSFLKIPPLKLQLVMIFDVNCLLFDNKIDYRDFLDFGSNSIII